MLSMAHIPVLGDISLLAWSAQLPAMGVIPMVIPAVPWWPGAGMMFDNK